MEYAIEVENLTKVYGKLKAVDDVSFKVKKGEIFAFLGPNGAGKTTTVEMIETIRKPTKGKIRVLGQDIWHSTRKIKEFIGVLPQEFNSFERLTVRETLLYFSRLYRKRVDIDRLIQLIDLKDKEKSQYRTLSGGLKQRVGVAIALVNDPEIVFLDEPTTGLDPKARRDVWEVIAGLRKEGKTVFLTTHYMEEAEYLADHVAIIHHGRIVAEGSPEELIKQHGEKSTLFIKRCKIEEAIPILKEIGLGPTISRNGDLRIKIDEREGVMKILSHLKEKNIGYGEVDIKRSDLEDVFLNLTGARLREET